MRKRQHPILSNPIWQFSILAGFFEEANNFDANYILFIVSTWVRNRLRNFSGLIFYGFIQVLHMSLRVLQKPAIKVQNGGKSVYHFCHGKNIMRIWSPVAIFTLLFCMIRHAITPVKPVN
jgi:hypothetical protein